MNGYRFYVIYPHVISLQSTLYMQVAKLAAAELDKTPPNIAEADKMLDSYGLLSIRMVRSLTCTASPLHYLSQDPRLSAEAVGQRL